MGYVYCSDVEVLNSQLSLVYLMFNDVVYCLLLSSFQSGLMKVYPNNIKEQGG